MLPADESRETGTLRRRNDRVLAACVVFVVAMVGLSFAAVPFYRMFCQVTGYGGTTARGVAAPGSVGEAVFTIRFDSNVAPGLPWQFRPGQRSMKVHAGEEALTFFVAANQSGTATVGSATFNVQPDLAGQYFRKVQCFCFEEQALAPGQKADMPLTFYVDPAILADKDLQSVRTITLSYTFFPAVSSGSEKAVSAEVKATNAIKTRAN